MKSKQLAALFLCSLICYTLGNGLLPLLPVYATQLGANPALAGNYMAFSYFALALGTLAAGRLSDTVQHRKEILAVSAALWIPLTWAMGRIHEVWQLAVLTAAVWFLGGMSLTLLSVIAGLFAERSERGRVFGILTASSALGSLIGGLTMGPIADRWGYPVLFLATALWSVPFLPLAGFIVEDKLVAFDSTRRSERKDQTFGAGFVLLILASAVAFVALLMGSLGRSLVMRQMGFVSSDISSTLAVVGAVSLPLSPLLGRFSDRIGRRQVLMLGYLLGSAGLCILAVSAALWQFQAGSALMGIISAVGFSAGPALVADLVPPQTLGRGMSLYNTAMWCGGIIGLALMGHTVQALGGYTAFILAALLALFAIAVLLVIRPVRRGLAPGATGASKAG